MQSIFTPELIRDETGVLDSKDFEKIKSFYDEARSFISSFKELLELHSSDDEFVKHCSLNDMAYKKLNEDFEIAVIGTSGSGKSSLINAMLSTELLPTRDEDARSKLFQLHDDKDGDRPRCEYVDVAGRQKAFNPVMLENLRRLNSDDSSDIHIYGSFSSIASQELKLVLTDVPSVPYNDCEEQRCKYYVNKVLQDSKSKPLVLCVLDATQIEACEPDLLKEIADAMRLKGRQAKDRFLFVLNKVDKAESERGQSIEEMLEKTKAYLAKDGIENPRIFPCSAYYACLIRRYWTGEELCKEERDTLKAAVSRSVDDSNFHFHTGIPLLEECIFEYVQKYAVPHKIAEALASFKTLFDDLPDMLAFEY